MRDAAQTEPYLGQIEGIPVRNIWLLMLYASDLFREVGGLPTAVENNPDDIPNLVAEILVRAVSRRLQRDLSYGYVKRCAVLGRIRGRINVLATERHQLLARGKVACQFEELTINTPRNCFVRAALDRISKLVHSSVLARRCQNLAENLKRAGVTDNHPNPAEVSLIRFGLHDAEDKRMVSAAQLAFALALPTEQSGHRHLPRSDRDKNWIRKVYEKGIAGFYDVVLSSTGWLVQAGKTLSWPITAASPGINQILPSMRTDIVLSNELEGRRIVIDTKFNSVVKRGWHREESLRSGYIYQIYAYLRSQENKEDPLSRSSTGLLLHPALNEMVNESVIIQGHEVQFATVDLAADANEIRRQLLGLIKSADAGQRGLKDLHYRNANQNLSTANSGQLRL